MGLVWITGGLGQGIGVLSVAFRLGVFSFIFMISACKDLSVFVGFRFGENRIVYLSVN